MKIIRSTIILIYVTHLGRSGPKRVALILIWEFRILLSFWCFILVIIWTCSIIIWCVLWSALIFISAGIIIGIAILWFRISNISLIFSPDINFYLFGSGIFRYPIFNVLLLTNFSVIVISSFGNPILTIVLWVRILIVVDMELTSLVILRAIWNDFRLFGIGLYLFWFLDGLILCEKGSLSSETGDNILPLILTRKLILYLFWFCLFFLFSVNLDSLVLLVLILIVLILKLFLSFILIALIVYFLNIFTFGVLGVQTFSFISFNTA